MKSIALFGAIIAVLLLTVFSAAALTVSEASLGGDSQKRNETVSNTITLTNNDNASVSGVTLTSSADAKYKINYSNVPSSLAAGASATVTVTGFATKDFDAVDLDGKETSFVIGSTSARGILSSTNATVTASANIKMQAKNELNIKKGRVGVGTRGEKSVNDGTSVNDIKPGDSLRFRIAVENNFPSRGEDETDFDNVDVKLDFDNEEDFDINDDSESFSLSANDEEEVTFNVDVADDARDRTTRVTVTAIADDENGARHGESWDVRLEVKRDLHDLTLKSVDVSPTRIPCKGSRNVQVTANVLNIGRTDEDESALEVIQPDLGIASKSQVKGIDEDDSETMTVSFAVPADANPGVYALNIYSVYDVTTRDDFRQVNLQIDDCKEQPVVKNVTQPTQTQPVQQPPVTQPVQPVVITQPQQTARVSTGFLGDFADSPAYVAVLAGVITVIVVVIIGVLVKAFRRP